MFYVGTWYQGKNRRLAVNLAKLYSERLGYKVFVVFMRPGDSEGELL